MFLLNLEIGYLTPPVGLNLFISSLRFDRSVTLLYRAVLPFVGLLIVALGIVTYIPWFSTVLLSEEDNRIDLETPLEGAGDLPRSTSTAWTSPVFIPSTSMP